MERPNEEVLARLSQAVDSLDDQIALAHAVLSDQLNDALRPLNVQDEDTASASQPVSLPNLEPSPEAVENHALHERVAVLEQSLAETREHLDASEARAGLLEKDLASTRESLAGLTTQLEAAREESAQLRDRVEDAEEELEEAESLMATLEAKTAEEKAEGARSHSEAQQAWSQIASMEKERQKLLDARTTAESALHETEARAQASESQCREALERIRTLVSEVEQLRADLQEATETASIEKAPVLVEHTFRARDAQGRKRRFGEVLVEAGVLTEAQVAEIAREQAVNPQRKFGTLVVELGYSTEEVVARVLAAQLSLPYSALEDEDIDRRAVKLASANLARQHQCVPVRREGDVLWLAMANPLDLIAIEDIELTTSMRVEPLVAKPASIQFVIDRYSPES